MSSASNTALTIAGVNSLLPSPYRPPQTFAVRPAANSAALTSKYNGSPSAPASFVRSSTAIRSALSGIAVSSASAENGRNSRTRTTPTFSPVRMSARAVSSAVSAPDPISTSTFFASGTPV